ncbi:MAG: RNA polymerase sporulation sigma factor SigG [Clostridia bacterium]|nr:RNA polymerase sporulation sigma factor SigG [Clostridia bacterium]
MINKVEISGVNTSTLPVLSNEEKSELLFKIKNGDVDARQKFINGNLKLVLSVIKKFRNSNDNADDLFQIGCVGLIKAIDNFDISQNVQFSTYAVPMIIGEIRRYLRDNNPIRVSRSVRNLAYKALMAKEQLLKKTQDEPTIEQIAQIVGVEKEQIAASLDAIQDPVSLHDSVHGSTDSENLFLIDQISDKKANDERWTDSIAISEAMKKLSKREKDIIKRRFFDCKTQMEVADEIGISQAQVSRLEKNAIKNIKKNYI